MTAQLVDFPTGKDDFYPIQPKLRITNNTGVTLAQGTQISLDLPTSTPPVVKDNDYKEIKGLTPGHTGPNVGGLKGDFHRLTLTLGYCEDLAPGKSRDIDLKYYLPITGPSNVTFTIGGKEYASTGDRRRDVSAATPPAPSTGSECQAATWKQGQVYRPDGGRLWRMYDKGDKGWMFEYGDSPPGNPMMIDNNPDQSRVHLVEAMEQNPNQYWKIQLAGEGTYTVSSGERCMTATAARKDIASLGCDGRAEQKWKLVPIADNGSEGAPGAPKHNGVFKLRSLSGGNDLEVAGGTTDQGTHPRGRHEGLDSGLREAPGLLLVRPVVHHRRTRHSRGKRRQAVEATQPRPVTLGKATSITRAPAEQRASAGAPGRTRPSHPSCAARQLRGRGAVTTPFGQVRRT